MAVGSSKRALQQHLSQMLKSMVSSAHGDHITTVMEGILKPGWRVPSSSCQGSHGVRRCYTRKLSQLRVASSRAFLVDTLALVRRLEAQGLAAKQAEAITAVMTEVLSGSLDDVTQSFVFKADMQREFRFVKLQRETERLRTDVDKMHNELKYEIDKVRAGQRLDLNLERGRVRDELSNQSAKTSNLTNKLDKEIHALKTQIEAAKFEVIKYSIGTIVSVTAVGLGLLRIIM
ncbi:hypothetical protein O6H91_02G095900 [Diphasiastrum complanatum]|uniref:Uncharacterized protein n=1 Tax=Diphasiastrum complanatum TaxID=34168 RepID=A0ACC2EIA8_DIPCM|nr:hypothetical protein O6H91_02G095900 [Diphasiastrum complanatum]